MSSDDLGNERKDLLDLIIKSDRASANALLDKLAVKSSYRDVILSHLEPVLTDIGEMWIVEELSLAQGYVAGKIAEDILAKAIHSGEYSAAEKSSKGTVVIGNTEDDYHALGRKMVATFLKMSGWQVHDLGNDVLAEDFVSKAIEVNACIIGVSAMMYSTADNIKKLRHEMDTRGLKDKVLLAVGGAVFKLRPELVHEVGGDGTANSAVNAPKLFEELYQRILHSGNKT